MFTKLLIANRGEIACRIIATARRLGMATVAVFSEADAGARHVDLADEAYSIGAAPARESYLDGARIIEVARRSGAEAIHPGYGFLSENADFAEAVTASGIVWVGPPAAAIRAMGSKAAAKALMAQSGVPLVPGYHGEAQDFATLSAAAGEIGYPVLIKASAGGGGKGMRIVEGEAALADAVAGARREAAASFGDDRLLVEKYLTQPRHIEIQVFADGHGNVVSLFERDCSIQRRHQKVVEEAPAPVMEPARRVAMGEAACAAARAVGYVGAGTVEFIAQDDAFHFMEMNTRLQVEHPVTEMITGLDLVEWQLRVASGEKLPWRQEDFRITGHAIEVRVYAEDPARNFLPSIGRLAHLRQPRETASVRVDTGVRQGDAITPYYDPMIAKLIVHGADRGEAVRRLAGALAEYEVVGVATNLPLLRAIAAHPDFAEGVFDTGFIGRHPALLEPEADTLTPASVACACLAWCRDERATVASSPWECGDAWRMNGAPYQELTLSDGAHDLPLRLDFLADGNVRLWLPDASHIARATDAADGAVRLALDGGAHRLRVVPHNGGFAILERGQITQLFVVDRLAPPRQAAAGAGGVAAPIPARVTRVLVTSGDTVAKGAALLVLEAMKMEITLSAPAAGTVDAVRATVGEMVEAGIDLVTFSPVAS